MKGRVPAFERESSLKKGGGCMQHNTRPIMAALANPPDPHKPCEIPPDIVFSPSMLNVYISTDQDLLHVDQKVQKVRIKEQKISSSKLIGAMTQSSYSVV
jgi:hypothetical protein